ncbi:MAG: DNA polymerase III subunit chi, partial [Pseudomonadota bacterium]
PDAAALERLDTLLWTFTDDSFVPHDVALDGQRTAPVTLADAARPLPEGTEVCINLCDDTVETDCPRIAEIVSGDDAGRANGRQRYASYRERGLDLDMHEL